MLNRRVQVVEDDIKTIETDIRDFFATLEELLANKDTDESLYLVSVVKENLSTRLFYLKDDFDAVHEMLDQKNNEVVDLSFQVKELKESIEEYKDTIDEMGQRGYK